MKFTIDENYICSVNVTKEWGIYDNIPREKLTNEQLVNIIKGKDRCSMSSSEDHPEFTVLREKLAELGYIEIERKWWNGDRVLKPFQLNEWKFKKGHQFSSAAAMRVSINCARKHGWKSISKL